MFGFNLIKVGILGYSFNSTADKRGQGMRRIMWGQLYIFLH